MTFKSNCNVCSRVVKGRDSTESYAFVEVCKNCINTCWQCGGDVGWLNPKMITIDSNNECEKCHEHVGCKSCGINITCKECKMVICNSCIILILIIPNEIDFEKNTTIIITFKVNTKLRNLMYITRFEKMFVFVFFTKNFM